MLSLDRLEGEKVRGQRCEDEFICNSEFLGTMDKIRPQSVRQISEDLIYKVQLQMFEFRFYEICAEQKGFPLFVQIKKSEAADIELFVAREPKPNWDNLDFYFHQFADAAKINYEGYHGTKRVYLTLFAKRSGTLELQFSFQKLVTGFHQLTQHQNQNLQRIFSKVLEGSLPNPNSPTRAPLRAGRPEADLSFSAARHRKEDLTAYNKKVAACYKSIRALNKFEEQQSNGLRVLRVSYNRGVAELMQKQKIDLSFAKYQERNLESKNRGRICQEWRALQQMRCRRWVQMLSFAVFCQLLSKKIFLHRLGKIQHGVYRHKKAFQLRLFRQRNILAVAPRLEERVAVAALVALKSLVHAQRKTKRRHCYKILAPLLKNTVYVALYENVLRFFRNSLYVQNILKVQHDYQRLIRARLHEFLQHGATQIAMHEQRALQKGILFKASFKNMSQFHLTHKDTLVAQLYSQRVQKFKKELRHYMLTLSTLDPNDKLLIIAANEITERTKLAMYMRQLRAEYCPRSLNSPDLLKQIRVRQYIDTIQTMQSSRTGKETDAAVVNLQKFSYLKSLASAKNTGSNFPAEEEHADIAGGVISSSGPVLQQMRGIKLLKGLTLYPVRNRRRTKLFKAY